MLDKFTVLTYSVSKNLFDSNELDGFYTDLKVEEKKLLVFAIFCLFIPAKAKMRCKLLVKSCVKFMGNGFLTIRQYQK